MTTHAGAPSELPVSLAFFASGASALIFEVVWFHRCGLVFGNSIWSMSIVLSSFMGGLALGNALVGWSGHVLVRLLRTYAWLEVVVAITGVAVVYALPEIPRLLVPLARGLAGTPWLLQVVHLIAAFSILIVPSTAMGATLPVLVGALCRWRGGFGRVVGRLYGWNTLGAVAGVVGAEMVLVGRYGVAGSAWVAALLNLGAAATALWMSRRTSEGECIVPAAVTRDRRTAHPWRLLICAFLAGAALLALEGVWFRFLGLFVLNSTRTFSLMLAVVLTAIACGGFAGSVWLRRNPRAAAYASAVALAAGFISALSYAGFQVLTDGRTAEWRRILWFACTLTFAPSLLSGVLFTLLGELMKGAVDPDTRAAGWLTLANTTGAMCGPLIATFVLLPSLGIERTFFAIALLYCGIGLLLTHEARPLFSTAAGRASLTATVAAAIVLVSFPFGVMSERYFERAAAPHVADGSRVIATREGSTETIFLLRQAWMGQPIYDRLVTNGFSMSGTHLTGVRYMRYFVYLPMLLHDAPIRRVLVVCYGVGVTAGAATEIDSAESIDVVEISRDVIAMSDIIYPPGRRPLDDSRVRLHVADGRQFLQVANEEFDLITGEPPPPLTPGTVNLYTREYFQLVYDRLAPGGIATYWLPIAREGEYDAGPIIRAFCDAFTDCSLWNGTLYDWMLVGTRGARGPVSAAQFSRAWSDPVLGPRLREIGFELPQQIGATFLGDASYLRSLTADTPPLTDNHPQRLLRQSPAPLTADPRQARSVEAFEAVIDPSRASRSFRASAFIRSLWPEPLIDESSPFFEYQRVINQVMAEGANPLRDIERLDALLTRTALRRLPLWQLGSNDVVQRVADTGNDGTGMVEYTLALRLLVARNYGAAASYLSEAERRGFPARTARPLRAYALCMAGQLDAGRELAPQTSPSDPDERHFWTWLDSRFGITISGGD